MGNWSVGVIAPGGLGVGARTGVRMPGRGVGVSVAWAVAWAVAGTVGDTPMEVVPVGWVRVVLEGDGVIVAVAVAVAVDVTVGVGRCVSVARAVTVGGASRAVAVEKGVGDGKGVRVLVAVLVGRGVPIVGVLVGVLVGVRVGVHVGVRVGRGVPGTTVCAGKGCPVVSSPVSTIGPTVPSGVGVGRLCLLPESLGVRSQPTSSKMVAANTIQNDMKAELSFGAQSFPLRLSGGIR